MAALGPPDTSKRLGRTFVLHGGGPSGWYVQIRFTEDPSRFGVTAGRHSPISSGLQDKHMNGERELTAGKLSKDVSFRLIVSGHVGETEIDCLIGKLQSDKQILAEPDDSDPADEWPAD
jgi:hypothetical protein